MKFIIQENKKVRHIVAAFIGKESTVNRALDGSIYPG
jgi:hypothetical protein